MSLFSLIAVTQVQRYFSFSLLFVFTKVTADRSLPRLEIENLPI